MEDFRNAISADDAEAVDEAAAAELAERQRLTDELGRLREELEAVKAASLKAEAAALEEGRQAALAEYTRRDEDLLVALRKSAETGLSSFEARLSDLESLSLAISAAALEGVLSGHQDYRDQLVRAIRLQIAGLRRESVIEIHVSSADFPDMSVLEAAMGAGLMRGIKWTRNEALDSGEARFELRLGHIEFSLREHWDQVQDTLRSLVLEPER